MWHHLLLRKDIKYRYGIGAGFLSKKFLIGNSRQPIKNIWHIPKLLLPEQLQI